MLLFFLVKYKQNFTKRKIVCLYTQLHDKGTNASDIFIKNIFLFKKIKECDLYVGHSRWGIISHFHFSPQVLLYPPNGVPQCNPPPPLPGCTKWCHQTFCTVVHFIDITEDFLVLSDSSWLGDFKWYQIGLTLSWLQWCEAGGFKWCELLQY